MRCREYGEVLASFETSGDPLASNEEWTKEVQLQCPYYGEPRDRITIIRLVHKNIGPDEFINGHGKFKFVDNFNSYLGSLESHYHHPLGNIDLKTSNISSATADVNNSSNMFGDVRFSRESTHSANINFHEVNYTPTESESNKIGNDPTRLADFTRKAMEARKNAEIQHYFNKMHERDKMYTNPQVGIFGKEPNSMEYILNNCKIKHFNAVTKEIIFDNGEIFELFKQHPGLTPLQRTRLYHLTTLYDETVRLKNGNNYIYTQFSRRSDDIIETIQHHTVTHYEKECSLETVTFDNGFVMRVDTGSIAFYPQLQNNSEAKAILARKIYNCLELQRSRSNAVGQRN